MRNPLLAISLFAVAGGILWWTTARPLKHSSKNQISREEPNAPAPSARKPAPTPTETEIADAATEAVAAPSLPGPVLPGPKPVSLATVEEPPAAPETAEAVSSIPPVTTLENMRSAIRQYSSRFGGNPVGSNSEITSTLNGGNTRKAVFVNPDDGLRINERGELIDNWGTPYFFHQLSRTEMEIHSAGPDRRLWTADDLVMK